MWHHGEVSADNLRVVAANELRFCDYDASKNKNRKRKICLVCRGKIVLEIKCAKLEISEYNDFLGFRTFDFLVSLHTSVGYETVEARTFWCRKSFPKARILTFQFEFRA